MDATYLVEIRLSRTKWRIAAITNQIARQHGIGDFIEKHPHVTLFGPLILKNGVTDPQLLEAVGGVAARYDPVPFLIDGWEKREGMHGSVIAFPVTASEQLRQLTRGIAEVLSPITTSLNAYDGDPDRKWFHVTIANRLESARAEEVYAGITGTGPTVNPAVPEPRPGLLHRFLRPEPVRDPPPAARTLQPVLLDETGIRITVMKEDGILGEYDLLEKRWLAGDRHNTPRWQRTLGRFRHHAGLEHRDPRHGHPDDIFFIADLHLGHANIIRYCSRPFHFSDCGEMDHVLIKNWNYSIGPGTRIYCLGDLRYGAGAEPAPQYRKRLRGDIVFLRGNHDEPEAGMPASLELECDGRRFFLVHDPAEAPPGYDGWVIHGHHHNTDLRTYPFMNFEPRRINVSVEVTGYRPVGLQEILGIIRAREASGDRTPLLLRPGSEPAPLPF